MTARPQPAPDDSKLSDAALDRVVALLLQADAEGPPSEVEK